MDSHKYERLQKPQNIIEANNGNPSASNAAAAKLELDAIEHVEYYGYDDENEDIQIETAANHDIDGHLEVMLNNCFEICDN